MLSLRSQGAGTMVGTRSGGPSEWFGDMVALAANLEDIAHSVKEKRSRSSCTSEAGGLRRLVCGRQCGKSGLKRIVSKAMVMKVTGGRGRSGEGKGLLWCLELPGNVSHPQLKAGAT